ncbi:acyltransferase [Azotobacter chroococcum]|uniref:acyltransferase family protein n=1 Tax=Azotobacter chroococcum TaxID=353 RepID=UPI00103D940F|nr:acyltransferase [Azotobacter chroococcum]TBW08921.1 acyltransferase [Azotobacter chroococcum]
MLNNMNWIRGIATILIVLGHVRDGVSYTPTSSQDIYMQMALLEASCIFIAISGFFFQLNMEKYTMSVYFSKKINNVIIPYLVISLPAILIYVLKIKTEHSWMDMDVFYDSPVPLQILTMIFTGAHLGPLWFIPALFFIYLAAPLLKELSRSHYFPAIAISSIAVFFITSRPENNSNPILAAIHFMPMYLAGMYFCKVRDKIKSTTGFYLFTTTTIILSITSSHFTSLFGIQKLSLFFALYYFFLAHENIIHKNKHIPRALGTVGMYSFSIYFLHGYFVGAYRILSEHITPDQFINYLLILSLLTTATILPCIGIVSFAKKMIGNKSRLIFGT